MGKYRKKKGQSGEVKMYITRNAAVKKLQLSLRDFRRLCILKGIYPREPAHRMKVQRGNSEIKTLYYMKDIQFLMHEPIIWKFRDHRAYMLKIKKARARKERAKVSKLWDQKPLYRLDHIVRERYPSLVDALQDLDDPLTLCFLFAKMARNLRLQEDLLKMAERLTVEFMLYVIEAHALRKVFISIKGYYYQAEIMGQLVTWIAPHPFTPQNVTDVDLRLMKTFVEFYITLLGFVNFRLYHNLNLYYPPKLRDAPAVTDAGRGNLYVSDRVASLNIDLKRNQAEEQEEGETIDTHLLGDESDQQEAQKEEKLKQQQQSLFKGLKFYLSRETNIESLTFVIRACMGQVSWDPSSYEGSTYPEDDTSITHEIVDRPLKKQTYLSRYYVQPQWVYDCINARLLLPVQDYFLGVPLPAHLSPFNSESELYVPPEQKKIMALQRGEVTDSPALKVDSDSDDDDNNKIEPHPKKKAQKRKHKKKKEETNQEAAEKKQEEETNQEAAEKKQKEETNQEAAEKKQKEETNQEAAEKKQLEGNEEKMEESTGEEKPEDQKDGKENVKEGENAQPARRQKKMSVHGGHPVQVKKSAIKKQEAEERRLSVMMIPRKLKRIYNSINRKEQRQLARVEQLTEKREKIERSRRNRKIEEKQMMKKREKKLSKSQSS